MPGRCPLCGREVDESCERLPSGGGWAHRECLQGRSDRAKAVQEILATLDETPYGKVIIHLEGGKPVRIEQNKSRRIG